MPYLHTEPSSPTNTGLAAARAACCTTSAIGITSSARQRCMRSLHNYVCLRPLSVPSCLLVSICTCSVIHPCLVVYPCKHDIYMCDVCLVPVPAIHSALSRLLLCALLCCVQVVHPCNRHGRCITVSTGLAGGCQQGHQVRHE